MAGAKVERYVMPHITAYIEAHPGGHYTLSIGGCGIGGPVKDIKIARDRLHEVSVIRLRDEQKNLSTKLAQVDAALARLGDDPFNLGRFLSDD